jgi:hypothetical protein
VKLTNGVSSGLEKIPAFLTNERVDYAHEGPEAAINFSESKQSGKRDTTRQGYCPSKNFLLPSVNLRADGKMSLPAKLCRTVSLRTRYLPHFPGPEM